MTTNPGPVPMPEFSDAEYASLFGQGETPNAPAPAPAPAMPPDTQENYQVGTAQHAAAQARDGLARLVYSHPPTLGGLFVEAATVLASQGSPVLPGQTRAGRTGSSADAEARLADLSSVPVNVVRSYVDDAMRRTLADNIPGHRDAMIALAYARCANPMVPAEELPALADGILGTTGTTW